ncbi:hypothetical protein M3Y98_00124400 [Aphelenchoides besseyi]|nr:hypothetical protein M3Y98_00124400 [Aphelenchoides besseyi]
MASMDQNNNTNPRSVGRNGSRGLQTFVPLVQMRGHVMNRHSASGRRSRIPGTISRLSLADSANMSTARINNREQVPLTGTPSENPAPPPKSCLRSTNRSITARSGSAYSFLATQNSAERLNLYIDRHDAVDQTEEDVPGVTFQDEPKTPREKFKQNLRIILPHVGLVILSALYTLLGAAIFNFLEAPFEVHIRNATAHRVQHLKDQIIAQLWTMAKEMPTTRFDFLPHNITANGTIAVTRPYQSTMDAFREWSEVANAGLNEVIADVFVDYTKNYLTVEDVINGTGVNKWSFGSSIFFSLTAISTIGYGHIVPRTLVGRVVCLLYALFGIPLILVTIADMGRFLSGGIIWVHNTFRSIRKGCYKRIGICFRRLCCRVRRKKPNSAKKTQQLVSNGGPVRTTQNHVGNHRGPSRPQKPNADNVSDAGTFEDVSEIPTQEGTSSEDTHARADELDEFEGLQPEKRVSVVFILCLWEPWSFVDAFYFCAVTVTTIGFGDIVPNNGDFLWATLAYIVIGLIITTMCIDLVGSEYIRDIHFYGRSLGRSFLTIGGKVVHLGEVFSYVAFLQKNYGLTPDQLDKLAQLPEEYLLDCMINGKQPDLDWVGGKPYIPPDIYYFKWIEHPRTLSFASERVLASMESLDLNTSRCSTARTLTPREYYTRILHHYAKQMQSNPPGMAGQLNILNANAQPQTSGRLPHSISAQTNLNVPENFVYNNRQSTDRAAIIAMP